MKSLDRTLNYVLVSGVTAWIVALFVMQICYFIWSPAYMFEYEILTKPSPSDLIVVPAKSDATTTIKTPRVDLMSGKPLALQGLVLIPKRPQFTSLQDLYGIPNMLVEIQFGANGMTKELTMLNSSGNIGIDVAVKVSLYRWRARGEQLKGLDEDETVVVRLELFKTSPPSPDGWHEDFVRVGPRPSGLRPLDEWRMMGQFRAGSGEWYEWKLQQQHQITASRVHWSWRANFVPFVKHFVSSSPNDYILHESTTVVDGQTFHGPQVQDILVAADLFPIYLKDRSSYPASNDVEVEALMSMGDRQGASLDRWKLWKLWFKRDLQVALIPAAFGTILGFIIYWRRLIKRAIFGAGNIASGAGKIGAKASHAIDDKLDELNK